jgi:hypothetical protein
MITLLIAPVALRIAWVKNMRELAELTLYAATLYIHFFTYSAETAQVFAQTALAHLTAEFTKKNYQKNCTLNNLCTSIIVHVKIGLFYLQIFVLFSI